MEEFLKGREITQLTIERRDLERKISSLKIEIEILKKDYEKKFDEILDLRGKNAILKFLLEKEGK